LAQLTGSTSFFSRSKYVGQQTEPFILELFEVTLGRLNNLMPQDPRWLYALGDAQFDKADLSNTLNPNQPQQQTLHFSPHYLEAIRYYLLGGAVETSFFY